MKLAGVLSIIGVLLVAGCARQPTQADLELQAYNRVLADKVASGKMSPAEADLARQQYAGALRTRESAIAANQGAANAGNAYAGNSSMAIGMTMFCAGQRGGHC